MNMGGKLRISVSKIYDIYVCENVLMKHIICTVTNNINNQNSEFVSIYNFKVTSFVLLLSLLKTYQLFIFTTMKIESHILCKYLIPENPVIYTQDKFASFYT